MSISQQTLKSAVLRVVRSSAAQSINFSFQSQTTDDIIGGRRVTFHGTSLARVARAIERGQIRIRLFRRTRSHDVLGEYDDRENDLYIDSQIWNSPQRDAVILHEAVHASQDAGFLLLSQIDAEIMAYIVETIYQLRTGGSLESVQRFLVPARQAANAYEIDESEIFWLYRDLSREAYDAGQKMIIDCGRNSCYPIYDSDGVGRRRR